MHTAQLAELAGSLPMVSPGQDNRLIEQTYGEGVRVVVDPQSAEYLSGASLDYKDGLQDAGFTINNPNAQRTCGCGQSFS